MFLLGFILWHLQAQTRFHFHLVGHQAAISFSSNLEEKGSMQIAGSRRHQAGSKRKAASSCFILFILMCDSFSFPLSLKACLGTNGCIWTGVFAFKNSCLALLHENGVEGLVSRAHTGVSFLLHRNAHGMGG